MHLVGLIIDAGQPGGEEHVADRVGGQATQVHPLGVGVGRKARQEPSARVGGRPRAPVGRDDQDGRPPQLAHHIGEQDRRRLVRPLQIIEYQQEAARSRPPRPAAGAPRRTARTAGRCRNRRRRPEPGARRHRTQPTTGRHGTGRVSSPDGGLVQHQPPQAVRRRTAPVGRPGPRHRHAPRRGQRGSLLRQPGFPDSRLARAQHQTPAARQGIIQVQRDPSQLAVTADHHLGRIALHGATINGRELAA